MQSENSLELDVIEVQGTPRQLGEQLGEATREATRELYEFRLAAAARFARENEREVTEEQVLATARRCLPITERYDPAGYEEFLGIAHGAQLSPEQLFVTQGLTDLRDVLAFSDSVGAEGCSSFIVTGERTAGGQLLLGQSWDLLTDNLPYVRLIHRRPTDGSPATWSLTLTGCLTLIGLNSAGIAIGNTNLQTRDARPGTQYLSVLHRALRASTLDEAVAAVRDAPRSAAHYYYLADAEGRSVGLECSATQCAPLQPRDGLLIHCNHALSPEIAALEVSSPASSTACRQQRLAQLMETPSTPLRLDDIKRMLSDHTGGENAICRHGASGPEVSTNACVIMNPAAGELHACRGQAHCGVWHTVRV